MPKIYNHAHFPVEEYAEFNPEKYEDMVKNGALHSMRALPCTEKEDVIQLDRRLENSYPYMLEHFQEAGLDPTEEVIWDTSVDVAHDFPSHEVSSYSFNDLRNKVAPSQARLETATLCNNKNRFLQFCQENGYPLPVTIFVDEKTPLDTTQLKFPAYVKAARGSSGTNIYRVQDMEELQTSIQKVGKEYQIQEEVSEVVSFLNVQYKALGNIATHFATTEQVLSGFSHQGNRFPTEYESRHITDRLAGELASMGLEDMFAFDVAVTPDDMKIIECNARWNGSTYPTIVARKLGIEEWRTLTLPSTLEYISKLEISKLAYSRARRYGAILLNSSFLRTERKVSAMLAGSEELQQEIEEELRAALTQRYVSKPPVTEKLEDAELAA